MLIIEELIILTFFKRKLRKSSITWNKIIATLFYHIMSHNNLGMDHAFCYPQVSSEVKSCKLTNSKLEQGTSCMQDI